MKKAKIYIPTKTAMQSGRGKLKKWVLEFATKDTQMNPLMGWESSTDTLGEIVLKFSSKEKAIEYAENNNIAYTVIEPKQKEFAVDPDSFDLEELVFRVMNMDHIPLEPGRKKNPKTPADERAKVNFPAFKHYAYQGTELKEVVRSHWEGSLSNGQCNVNHGRITNKLGTMFLKLVERYSHRANWRGYTYVDEMRGQALVQLSQIGLQFDESKSDNPFAYYTAVVNNSFTRVLNIEKRNQTIRDDILIDQGHMPSFSRQIKHEEEIRSLRDAAESAAEQENNPE